MKQISSGSPLQLRIAGCALAAVSVVICAACGGSPLAPEQQPPDFLLITGMNVVAPGQATALQASAWYRGDASASAYMEGRAPVDVTRAAAWSSTTTAVALVASAGRVIGGSIGGAEISAGYQDGSYTLPLTVVRTGIGLQPYAGTWHGDYARTCERVVGIGRHEWCTFQGAPVVHRESLSLSLLFDGNVLRGTIRFPWGTAQVQAGLLEDGHLALGGTEHSIEHPGAQQLRDWRLSLTPDGRLAGIGVSDYAYRNIYGVQLDRQRYELHGLVRAH